MNVLIAGGVFRLPAREVAARQPTPEVNLANGLRQRGVRVATCRLEDRARIARANDMDIVHVHHLSWGAVAASLSPLARPFVFTPHQFGEPRSMRHRLGLEAVVRGASAIVCLSETERVSRQRSHPSSGKRLCVISNGMEPIPGAKTPRTLGVGEVMRLLFVGQLIDVKRVDRVLSAMAEDLHQQTHLRIVYHNDLLANDLKELAARLGVGDRVDFVGQRMGQQLYDEYSAAHALVLPSLSEALPSVITEALMTGLPVVASDVGGISEQLAGAGYVFEAENDQAFSPALASLRANYAAIAELAHERAGAVEAQYSVDRMVDAHLSLYEELLGRR